MAVTEPKMTAEEIGRRGEALYNAGIREKVETPENIGKFLALNVFTGDYDVATEERDALGRGLDRDPGGLFYVLRIGYDAAHTLGVWPSEFQR
jgi:hypothetical protein